MISNGKHRNSGKKLLCAVRKVFSVCFWTLVLSAFPLIPNVNQGTVCPGGGSGEESKGKGHSQGLSFSFEVSLNQDIQRTRGH